MEKKKPTKKTTKKKVAKKVEAKKPKVEGLGDVVEVITEKTGIKKAVKAVFGDDCGCEERRSLANIGRRIFNRRIENDMGCGGCVREVVAKLKKVYEAYKEENEK